MPSPKTRYRSRNIKEKRTPIYLKILKKDLAIIDEKAQAARLSRTEFLTRAGLGLKIEIPNQSQIPEINWQYYQLLEETKQEFNAIGNNLNQIARVLNDAKLKHQALPRFIPNTQSIRQIECLTKDAMKLIQDTQNLIKAGG